MSYDQISKVEKNYPPASPVTGKRIPPATGRRIGWFVLGGLAVVLIVLLKALSDPNF